MTGFYIMALHYVLLGLPVFPCKPRDKAPLTEHGFYDATIDANVIRDWSLQWPNPNLAVRTGVEHNGKKLVVIDEDPRNGGDDTLAALEREYGKLPDTAMVLTGDGGSHRYYWCPVHVTLQSKMGAGVDLKSDKGYVIAPPSIHPSGKPYTWEASSDLLEGAVIADLPDWIIEKYAKTIPKNCSHSPAPEAEVPEAEMAEIQQDLNDIPASTDRATWIEVLMALHDRSPSEQMFEVADQWSKTSPEKYDAVALRKAWDSFKPGGGITIKTLKRIAILHRAKDIDTDALLANFGKGRPITVGTTVLPKVGVDQEDSDDNRHTNQPRPTQAMLYGLVGEVGRAAAATTEANEYAVAAAYLTFLSAMAGRDIYLPIGNTWHHARIFSLHVGRSGRGRKGDALSLVHRIRHTVDKENLLSPLGQVHTGGLSTREGLAVMIHDGYTVGKDEVEAIRDKRLWVVESEFANVLHQSKRDGNTLSSALRDAWDGVSIKPAVKGGRIWTTDPHIAVSGAITPSELRSVMQSRELTNGFANRFLIFWAERSRLIEFPLATDQRVVNELARRTAAVIRFAVGSYPDEKDSRRMSLAKEAADRYAELYRGELNQQGNGELLDGLLERRAPVLLRKHPVIPS